MNLTMGKRGYGACAQGGIPGIRLGILQNECYGEEAVFHKGFIEYLQDIVRNAEEGRRGGDRRGKFAG